MLEAHGGKLPAGFVQRVSGTPVGHRPDPTYLPDDKRGGVRPLSAPFPYPASNAASP